MINEVTKSFVKRVREKDKNSYRAKEQWAKKHYYDRKERGDYSIVVDLWDEFELERDKNLIIEIERGEDNMGKKRVLVRLSKDYNVAEVEVSEIETLDEYSAEKRWALQEAQSLLQAYETSVAPKQVTPQQYTETVKPMEQGTKKASEITAEDILHRFHKGGQTKVLVDGMRNKKVTLEEVNACKSWADTQKVMEKIFSK